MKIIPDGNVSLLKRVLDCSGKRVPVSGCMKPSREIVGCTLRTWNDPKSPSSEARDGEIAKANAVRKVNFEYILHSLLLSMSVRLNCEARQVRNTPVMYSTT
jgi:hypothetical protein